MKKIINDVGNEILIFAKTFEDEAYSQIKKLSNFGPYRNNKIRIMPDAHAGKGCTVGTTMIISDKITPNLVGLDIGCGVLTVELKNIDMNYKKLDRIIKTKIPSGFDVHRIPKAEFDFKNLRCKKYVKLERAILSLGTLGGGNHFLSIEQSENAKILYLIIHTGSRKLGAEVCKYYQDKAFHNANEMGKVKQILIQKLKSEGREKEIDAELKKIQKPSADKELAFLTGNDFDDYMNDMSITQRFASLNRETIAQIIIREMGFNVQTKFENIHNYIDFKRMILRKGAVSSEKEELILIPINMRDGSLLCRGKGNVDWNYSAPHGAGRLMSRTKAKELITMDEFKESMKGIHTSSVVPATLDEAPQAYKSIDEIKNAITDTVEIIDMLKPVYNFKAKEEKIKRK